MLKKIIFATSLIAISAVYGQETRKETQNIKTKMDVFASKTGSLTKLIDTKLHPLRASFDSAETRIRKISNGNISGYFYQISKTGKYNTTTASIEYTDLVEVLKALKVLQAEVNSDISLNPDYLENKFVTVDGFQIGYYVDKGNVHWYISLEKYGSDNSLFIDKYETIETAFSEAKTKIDSLKAIK
ncbi:hypothetical protein EGY07_07820 [Chryseobacterium indologenes]|uniref:hypothetical protein n=1 Tax=Chryseobacterium indologenes TaxID=253 RepID=UPI000F4E14C6|nr:hypothetical protein [Chryseobacterium indologenes]AYZ35479.1 hypothetical protein EGY07_07820 [Chryseobacterium indologenes]MBF6644232.1 hypothetical protein [Chryseobacterium indologenes]MBU3047712.1 hypothetical protein [Chryseobacterium indologenes]MEB4759831.1 hypothetical protein [Chryseobacterium indologenes]QQQ72055.1 hypothetical protein JHW31_04810 [Chryseobacterium indologenes]